MDSSGEITLPAEQSPKLPKDDERGANLVEFAIIAPLLFLLLFGVIEFARLGYAFSEVWTAAREGARYATVVGDEDGNGEPNFVDCDGIEAAALSKVVVGTLGAADVDITYTTPSSTTRGCQGGLTDPTDGGDIDPGTEITVEVRAAFNSVVPLIGQFLNGITLDSSQYRTVSYGIGS